MKACSRRSDRVHEIHYDESQHQLRPPLITTTAGHFEDVENATHSLSVFKKDTIVRAD